jgi:hypothetical protein
LWRHQQTFGEVDPVFGHDLGFYVFVLPALSTLLAILAAAGLDMAAAFLIGRYDQLRSNGLLDRDGVTLWDKVGMMVTPGLNYALTPNWEIGADIIMLKRGTLPTVAGGTDPAGFA